MKQNLEQIQKIYRTQKPVRDGHMAAVHFGPIDAPIKLVYLHANGFNGLTYRALLEPIARENNLHIVALDLRGHGLTDLPTVDDNLARHINHGEDVAAYLRAHIDGSIILAGHSLGANTAIIAAGLLPEKIEKVLAFDPIVLPINARMIMATSIGRKFLMKNYPFAKNAGRRRDQFTSRDNVYKRYHGRGPFKHFPQNVLRDYIQDGFTVCEPSIDHEEDSVRLACRPKWEQLGYVHQAQNMKRRIKALPDGSRIIITDFVPQSENWMRRIRHKKPHIRIDYHPDKDHFFPISEPEVSSAALKNILGL